MVFESIRKLWRNKSDNRGWCTRAWYNNRGRRAELRPATSCKFIGFRRTFAQLKKHEEGGGSEFAMQSVEAKSPGCLPRPRTPPNQPGGATIRDTFENISSSILNAFVSLPPSLSLKLARNYQRLPVGSSVRQFPHETCRFIDRSRLESHPSRILA